MKISVYVLVKHLFSFNQAFVRLLLVRTVPEKAIGLLYREDTRTGLFFPQRIDNSKQFSVPCIYCISTTVRLTLRWTRKGVRGGRERRGGEDSIGQTDEKKDQDRSVTPLDLVGLTFECFVDSTASREEWEKPRGEEGLTGAIVVFILSFFHRILWVFVKTLVHSFASLTDWTTGE